MPRQSKAAREAAAAKNTDGSIHKKDGTEGTGRDGKGAQKATVGILNRSQDPENDAGRSEERNGTDRIFREETKPRWDAGQPSLTDQLKAQRRTEAELAGVEFAEPENDFAPTGGNNRDEDGGKPDDDEAEEVKTDD
jgi:hypothetical protein